ncbi:Oxygen-dependent choline dehydrogenase [Ensifer psoraleae]|uniref:GMC family oxidoreductase n=1 Tax=Sinorhizobium psoraleae TaxID=520838 RepID=UPI001569069D|nr:GMC family oxidoreductase N-terminal domain-containing protein [Sinorhizobium psoraleae]NRP72159.1 Oxygen-dependent choline dehydrogenase [Sinorhizobium psoraleae]
MSSYDYVVIGAGSAGCVVASRLTENPSIRVLLLEAGNRDNSLWMRIPAGFSKLIADPRYNWCYQAEPDSGLNNRRLSVPRGKGLGGSSSINGMLYVRGQAMDFDGWAQLGNRGWGYEEVLPYFRKTESFEGGDSEVRGRSGPLKVCELAEPGPVVNAFLRAAEAEGYSRNPDYNGRTQEGFGLYQVTQRAGTRSSAATAYLRPAEKRPNLHVVTNALVTRLLFDGRKCIGAEYRIGERLVEARAGCETLLCAGAVQSPQVLELSGIGQPARLRALGIEVRLALPGVGENYRDHYAPRLRWRVKNAITLNQRTHGVRLAWEVLRYAATRRGALSLAPGLACGFVRTRPELETPDFQYFFADASYGNAATRELEREGGMTLSGFQQRPESRGSIHAQSADAAVPPVILPNILSEELDRQCVVAGLKIARRIVENPAMDRYRAFELIPGKEVQSDDEWLDFARRDGVTSFHPMGTCRMGRDPLAVTDDELNVRGIGGLRVIDASIMPTMVSGNINAAVLMIGEKGAAMVAAAQRNAAPIAVAS